MFNKIIEHPFLFTMGLLTILFLTLFEIPEIILESQIKIQTQRILDRSDSFKFGTDLYSQSFLKHHPHLKLTDVTDEQGASGHLFYHVGETADNHKLGINVYYFEPSIFNYSNTKIQSIKVWNN